VRDISILYTTHRRFPRFDWFADSLAAQLDGAEVEVVFVDGLHSDERAADVAAAVHNRFSYRHVAPKPSPWNGPHRLTRKEYRGICSARNTGPVHASGTYLVFVDDCSVLMPGWWQGIVSAADREQVVGGARHKQTEMVVEEGRLVSGTVTPTGRDSRWDVGSDAGPVRVDGGRAYTSTLGMPRSLFLTVNGFDELCETTAGEDCHLGFRLENAGASVWFDRRILTIESHELHRLGNVVRGVQSRTLVEPETYRARWRDLGLPDRPIPNRCTEYNMLLDILDATRQIESYGNYYVLANLTEADYPATIEYFPTRHWFDGRPLSEI
jgi:glycosyltransferase involved in cell wall biosynthesis